MKIVPSPLRRAVLLLFVGLTCQVAPWARGTDQYIYMDGYQWNPAYLEITLGDTIYFVNDDYSFYDDHSSTSYTYPWSSGPIPAGYEVYFTPTKTGTYSYVDDYSTYASGTLVIKPAGPPPPPPPTLIPAPNRTDMVYDQGRDILYIANGTNVLRYQLAAASFLDPFQFGTSLMGIDLSPDGNTLMVADSAATTNVWVYVVDLTTGQSRQVRFPNQGERGTFAVAFGGDGAALITSRYPGSGRVPLRRYDPVSGLTTVLSSSFAMDSMVSSSGDGTTIILVESNDSGGPFHRYDVAQRAIIRNAGTSWYNYECAASRDGSLFALPTYGSTFIYDGNFNRVTNIGVYAGAQPIGAAFHPAADAVFFPFAGTTYVKAYSTTDWSLLAQYDFQNSFSTPGNHAFNNGRIRISPDGQIIFVTVNGGVSYLRHGLSLPLTHRLLVAGKPGPCGTSSPYDYGSYWLPDSTYVSLSVPTYVATNGSAALGTGWTGTGSAAGSGSGASVSFALTNNTTVTWSWTPLAISANLVSAPGGNQLVLQWPSLAGQTYDLLFATSPKAAFTPVLTGIAATPPNNTLQRAIGASGAGFYKIQMR